MESLHKKIVIAIILGVVLVVLVILGFLIPSKPKVESFDECVAAGNPVMESYPGKCKDNGNTFTEEHCSSGEYVLTLEIAKQIAKDSECGDRLKGNYQCNEVTGTYWIDLDIEEEGCNPACVINLETREAEINWRCTGLLE